MSGEIAFFVFVVGLFVLTVGSVFLLVRAEIEERTDWPGDDLDDYR